MEDYEESIGNYFGTTIVHPFALALVLALGMVTIVVPRRWAILPMIIASCSVSAAQRFVLGGFNFDFLRLMILFGWVRLLARGELRRLVWTWVDTWLVAYAVFGAVVFCLARMDGDSVKNRLGWAYDVFGFYFLFRFLLTDACDPKTVIKSFVVVAVPLAVFFALEYSTQRNFFSVLGGVPQRTWIKDGRIRCQGPFAHPIVAGVYWASILPLTVAVWWKGREWRTWAFFGSVAALVIVGATASSTPVMAVIFGVLGLFLYRLRRFMSPIRWGVVILLVALHLLMKKPVWHLIARVNVFDSSTGWHRYHIIDEAVVHFDEWWLSGTMNAANWDDVEDMTNEYVAIGIAGGLVTLLAYLGVIWSAFKAAGRQVARLGRDFPSAIIVWALGCSLFGHCMNFLALSYFGQVKVVWYLLLALIASQTAPAMRMVRARRPVPAPVARPTATGRRNADAPSG